MNNIRKIISALIIMLLPTVLLAQSGPYTISGKVATMPPTAKVYLICSTATGKQKDSISVSKGSFQFSGTIEKPKKAFLILNRRGTGYNKQAVSYIQFYLEPGMIRIESPDSLNNAKITAGPVNADNVRLNAALADINKKEDALNKRYSDASDETRKSKEFNAMYEKVSDSLDAVQKSIDLVFIKANPNSIISLFALKDYGGYVPDVALLEPAFNSLSVNIRSSKSGMDYATELEKLKKTAVGAMAPDFTETDTLGKMVALHDFKGKYVLVDFWASWCGPCREENPNVVKAYNQYKNNNFDILGVSLDAPNGKSQWIKAIQDDHLLWTQVADLKGFKNEAAQLYMVQAIPQNFLIGPDGKIVAKNLRGEALNSKLADLFSKK